MMKKSKKKLIALTAVILVVAIIGVFVNSASNKRKQLMDSLNKQEIATLEKRELVNSVSATGVVTSSDNKTVSASVNSVEFLELYYEVGDSVNAGDLLCVLDSSDLEESLSKAKTSLNNSLTKSNLDVESAERGLAEALATQEIQLERAANAVETAYQNFADQVNTVQELFAQKEEAEADLTEKENAYTSAQDQLTAASEALDNAKAAVDNAQAAYDAALGQGTGNTTDSDDTTATDAAVLEAAKALADAQTAYIQAQSTYDSALTQSEEAKAAYVAAQISLSSIKSSLSQAESTRQSLLSVYVQKAEAKEDTIRTQESTVANRTSSLETTKINASSTGNSDKQQIENYEEQIASCQVYAPISGVITSINYEVGDKYNGNTILTIEDISSYCVTTEIDEYDIGKIEKGQKVVIKTNATGDEELEGTVIRIAPRATMGSADVTYTVEISLDTPSDFIRLDMTAKLSIILDQKADALTVPYDAVQEDEEGNYYIEVVTENAASSTEISAETAADTAASEKIYITKGMESDYYIEVIGDNLYEGMEVIVPAGEDSGALTIQDLIEQRGAMGGF